LAGRESCSEKIEDAVIAVLTEGKVRTHDLGGEAKGSEITAAIVSKIA
jgi:isocitrate/isopropylmalate dehydrogenase